MIRSVKEEVLSYSTYLLLQGPKGFFFYKLAKYLKKLEKKVFKINFNGGDLVTYPTFKDVYNYRGKIEDFEGFIQKFLIENKIEVVILYGDYRPYHRITIEVSRRLQIPVYVLEEGYVRPDYITIEKYGINGWSAIPKDPSFYSKLQELRLSPPLPANNSYIKRTFSRLIHYLSLELLKWYFPYYRPCKKHTPYLKTIFYWFRGITYRKFFYKISEWKIYKKLCNELYGKYFLVPLQVNTDTQITIHSPYTSIYEFIEEVIRNFAEAGRNFEYLVFKHHPEDRGFTNYEDLINTLAEKYSLKGRIFYIHDFHLPSLLKGSKGVVVVNSTVGLQALYHGKPVKAMGRAIYNIDGLTFQGSLKEFFYDPGQVNYELVQRFRKYIIITSQLNGGFYGRFPFEY